MERGSIDAVSLRAVADAVGVTAPSIYLHFADKDELFFEVCHRRFQDLDDAIRAARLANEDDVVASLRAMGEAYVAYGLEHREHYQVLYGSNHAHLIAGRPDEELVGFQLLAEIGQLVHRGMQTGVLREADPMEVTVALWAGLHGVVSVAIMKEHSRLFDPEDGSPPPVAVDGVTATMVDTLLHGIVA